MSEGGDKTIRLTISIEKRAFDDARQGLRDLTVLAKSFVDVLNSAKIPGGLFTGAHQGPAATGGLGGTPTTGGGGALGSAVQGFAQGLTGTANVASAALKVMTQGVKTAVQESDQELGKLERRIQALAGAFKDLGGAPSGPGGDGGGGGGGGGPGARAARMAGWLYENDPFQNQGGGNNAVRFLGRGGGSYTMAEQLQAFDPFQSRGIGGARGGIPSRFDMGAIAQGYQSGGVWGALGAAGIGALPVALGAAATGAIVGGYNYLSSGTLMHKDYAANETLAAPFDETRRQAMSQQALGGLGMGLRHDINTVRAVRSITPKDLESIYGAGSQKSRIWQSLVKAGDTPEFSTLAKKQQEKWGMVVNTAMENPNLRMKIAAEALPGGGGIRAMQAHIMKAWQDSGEQVTPAIEAMANRAIGDILPEMHQTLVSVADQRRQGFDVQHSAWTSDFQSQYQGRMSLARMGRTSEAQAQLLGVGSNFSAEEHAGMRGRLGQVAGGRFMGASGRMLSLQAGGLQNAAELFGAAAGYGNAKGFMGAVTRASSMRGAGGLVDVAASGAVAGTYAGAMQSGDFFTSGEAGVGGILAATALLGGDLRASRAMQGGYEALAAYQGGRTDPLQQGINVLSSVSAASSGSLYEQKALRDMSPAARMDLMRKIATGAITDNNLPEELRLQGLTTADIVKYGKTQDGFMFARYLSSQGSQDVNAAVAGWRQEGAASLDGLKGRALKSRVNELGVAAYQAGLAPSVEKGRAFIAARLSETQFKNLTHGSVGDTAAGGESARWKQEHEDVDLQQREKWYASDDFKKDVRDAKNPVTIGLGTALSGPVGAATDALIKALTTFAGTLAGDAAGRDLGRQRAHAPSSTPPRKQ